MVGSIVGPVGDGRRGSGTGRVRVVPLHVRWAGHVAPHQLQRADSWRRGRRDDVRAVTRRTEPGHRFAGEGTNSPVGAAAGRAGGAVVAGRGERTLSVLV